MCIRDSTLTNLVDQMLQMASGAVFKEISKATFSNLEVPLPPLNIQHQLVAELDTYQKIIDGCNLIIENFSGISGIELIQNKDSCLLYTSRCV